MTRSVSLAILLLVVLTAVAYFVWPESEPVATDGSTTPDSVVESRGQPASGTRGASETGVDTAATLQAISEAQVQADSGDVGKAMETLAPHAAAGDAEARDLMGALNVQRLEDARRERVAYLVQTLSRAPEDATAQRFAILRELATLSPNDRDFAELRELYGELFIDELEAGLLRN